MTLDRRVVIDLQMMTSQELKYSPSLLLFSMSIQRLRIHWASSTSIICLATASAPDSDDAATLSANIGENSVTSSTDMLCQIGRITLLPNRSRDHRPLSS